MQDIYRQIVTAQDQGRPLVVVTVVAMQGHGPSEVQGKMLVDASGLVAGTVGGGALEQMALADAQSVLLTGQPLLREYALDQQADDGATPTGMVCGGRVTLFFEAVGRAVRVFLVGAGHVNRALHQYLAPLGFDVVFVDCREAQLASLPAPHLRATADYDELPDLPDLDRAFVVVATHSHLCDEHVLHHLLQGPTRPSYLGVVASRRKRVQLEANLRQALGADLDLGWIHMPVGLRLGGNSPAAVALSIAAEMQAIRHGHSGLEAMADTPAPTPKASS